MPPKVKPRINRHNPVTRVVPTRTYTLDSHGKLLQRPRAVLGIGRTLQPSPFDCDDPFEHNLSDSFTVPGHEHPVVTRIYEVVKCRRQRAILASRPPKVGSDLVLLP